MANRRILHIITQAHIDPAWLWLWRDGCAEALTTMQSAVDRMRETPDLCFTRSSAITYRWAQEMDPRLFAEIRDRIKEERWEVAGGWIEQADCNIPSTEALIRQALYGKGYLAEELGVDVRIGYNVDSFGHSGGLPQILAGSGYRYYVFMRPQEHEMDLPLLFWWESRDGSRVLCWRIPRTYCQASDERVLEEQIRAAVTESFPPGFDDGCFFMGLGNHGGGPTKRQIRVIETLRMDDSLPELRFSTLQRFFHAIERSPSFERIPVVRGELQHHARGCYSAHGAMKAINRRAERSLIEAEALAVLAGLDEEHRDPGHRLVESWWNVLFNQFHDILCGTCLEACYRDVADSNGAACDVAQKEIVRAVHAMARRVDTSSAAGPVLFLMNALPWVRRGVVAFDTLSRPHDAQPATQLVAADGERLPVQWLPPDSVCGEWIAKLVAVVDLPACGYRVFHLAPGDPPPAADWTKEGLSIADDGFGIASLRADDGVELLTGRIGLVVVRDDGDTWGHGVDRYRDEIGRPSLVSSRVVADGPLCRIVRQSAEWGRSEIYLDIATHSGIDAVDLRLRINWQERRQYLKLEIPTVLQDVRVFARMPGEVAEREPDGAEEPCQDWLALQGTIGGEVYSLGVADDSTYAYDCLDGVLRLALARSAPYAQHDPSRPPADREQEIPHLDQGWLERRFRLVCGKGPYQDLVLHRAAEELQTPVEYAMDSAHPGSQEWERTLLSVEPESLSVLAVKRAEDGDGIVIRVQEMQGRKVDARISILGMQVDWRGAVNPWEIRTLKITATEGRASVIVTDILEHG
jgi:alpha-mannosidase